MEITTLTPEKENLIVQMAALLKEAFPQSYENTSLKVARTCLKDNRIAIGSTVGDTLLGFVGAIPRYGVTGWELHPLVVASAHRRRGVGTMLCDELEKRLRRMGCLTIYLGSDDTDESTTLGGVNLFENTFEKIQSIQNRKGHAYEFYQKLGYQIVGVIPDANGEGKPDIWLAKSLFR